jgi:hypothetical protein
VLPLECGATTADSDPYEQNNRWMLEAAKRFGAQKVDFICLWNGQQGDGPGGTRHLMEEVRNNGGRVHWLDTTRLWRREKMRVMVGSWQMKAHNGSHPGESV